MNSNPEQFSLPEQPNNLPTAGENPNTAGHLEEIPYDKEPLAQHYKKDTRLDTDQLTQIQTGEYWSDRPPARELPVEAEQKKSKTGRIIASITGLALAAGVAIGLNANAKEDNTPPPAPVETSVVVNPNQTQQPEITPTPTQTIEVAPSIDTKDLKFYDAEGNNFQTYEDLKKSAELTVEDNPDQTKVFGAFIKRVEDIANYVPSIKTVRESLHKPTEVLTLEDFLLVAEQYRVAHDVMFSSESGELYDFSKALIQRATNARLQSLNASDEVPYSVMLTLHSNGLGLLVDDNSERNHTTPAPQLGDYTLISSGGNDITTQNGSWKIGGSIGVVKKPTR